MLVFKASSERGGGNSEVGVEGGRRKSPVDWCEKGRQPVPGAVRWTQIFPDAPIEEIKRPTYNMQNLVASPMKFSFLEGKLHGWVFSAGTSGVKAACWCWQCWARQPRQALRGAVLGRPQPLPRVPGSACARPLANSLRGGLKINTWACWAAFLAKINTASLPAPRELGHTRSLGAPRHPPGLRRTSHPTRGARRPGGCQIPPLTPAPATFSAGSQEENRACKPNSSRGSSSPPAREWETNSPMHRISKSSLLFPAILPNPLFFSL